MFEFWDYYFLVKIIDKTLYFKNKYIQSLLYLYCTYHAKKGLEVKVVLKKL